MPAAMSIGALMVDIASLSWPRCTIGAMIEGMLSFSLSESRLSGSP